MSVSDTQHFYQAQHKRRLSWMPWLFYRLKPKHKEWAAPWQADIQAQLCQLETVRLGKDCFIAPEAAIFAEPNRGIQFGNLCFVAANCFLHGPIEIGDEVAINHSCTLDGGKAGITIGSRTRIATQCKLYAFDHGMAPDQPIYQQANRSRGIKIGEDVWLGAGVGIRDGVTIGNGAVIGMNSMVTGDVPDYAIMVGNPARQVGDRRTKPKGYIADITQLTSDSEPLNTSLHALNKDD